MHRVLVPFVLLAAVAAPLLAQSPALVQRDFLKSPSADGHDIFGFDVAIWGDTLAVGAHLEDGGGNGVGGDPDDDSAPDAGSVHVLVRDGGSWEPQAYIKAPVSLAEDHFGQVVALHEDTLVVRATDTVGSPLASVYVYRRTGTTWAHEATLDGSLHEPLDDYGASLAVWGDTIVVGSPWIDVPASLAGGAYVFVRNGSTWTEQALLQASDAQLHQGFGSSVAIWGDRVVVGAGSHDGDGLANSGAVYVFERDAGAWTEVALLRASHPDTHDRFGDAVAVWDDTLVVGAFSEDGSGLDPADDSVSDAGAAYVFERDAAGWQQAAYLKAAHPGTSDLFGYAVAVVGDVVAVGAPEEDSASFGVAGDGSSDDLPGSGAAFVYERVAGQWSGPTYVKSSSPGFSDRFGVSLGLSGSTLAIGCPDESSAALDGAVCQLDDSEDRAGAVYAYEVGATPSPWSDLGCALGGATTPVLTGSGSLMPSTAFQLSVTAGPPAGLAHLVLGFDTLGAAFKSGLLVPEPQFVALGLPLDPQGALALTAGMPAGVPTGLAFVVQIWHPDALAPLGLSATNGVRGRVP